MQKRITSDLLTYLPGKALPALASFITVPIYTRLFLPDQFGNYILAVTIAEFLLLGTITGFGQAAVRFFSPYQLKSGLPAYFATLFTSVGFVTLAAAALCAALLLLLPAYIPADLYPLLWAALALFVVNAWYAILTDMLRGQEKSRWYTAVTIGQSYAGIIFGLLLVLVFKMGIAGLVWGQTLGLLLPILPLAWITTRQVRIQVTDFNRADTLRVWKFAWPVTMGNIAFSALNLSDRYIINLYRGSYEVGLYSVAVKISLRTIQLLASLFFLVPAPIVCRLWEERGREATEEALTAFTRMFLLMVLPAVTGLAVVAVALVRLLADEAYFSGHTAIWLVAYASMMLGLVDLASIGCLVTNRTRLIARNQYLAAAASLGLNFLLVPRFGFMGAAMSAAAAFSILALLQAFTSARFLTWRWPVRSLARVAAGCAAMAAGVHFLQAGLPAGTLAWQIASLLISIGVGALIYSLVLLATGEIQAGSLANLLRTNRRAAAATPGGKAAGQR